MVLRLCIHSLPNKNGKQNQSQLNSLNGYEPHIKFELRNYIIDELLKSE